MIIVLRRWLKSGGFQVILWVVLGIMAIVFLMPTVPQLRQKSAEVIATINGQDLFEDTLNRKALAFEEEMQQERRRLGQYADEIFKMLGYRFNPKEIAFEQMIHEALLDQVAQKVGIKLHQDVIRDKTQDLNFLQTISDLVPPYAYDQGGINPWALNGYLQRFGITTSDFNKEVEDAIKRNIVAELALAASYVPSFEVKDAAVAQFAPKRFAYIELSHDKFYKEEKRKEIENGELQRFFEQENARSKRYVVPEKREGRIWKFEPEDYNIKVSDEEVEKYYNTQKIRLYSEKPAEVQVRRILFTVSNESDLKDVLENARKVRTELLENPDRFAAKAKEISQDEQTAKKGGLMEPFSKNTHNIEFEKAAFLLKNDGDISNVIQTDKGVEIVQRVSKKPMTYKPLSAVQDEIKKKLELRKFKEEFLQDMKELLEDGDITQEELQEFIKRRGGTADKVEPLEKDNSKLAQKLFKLKKGGINFYIDGAIGVAVQLTEIQKPYTPSLQSIEKEVAEGLYHYRANKQLTEKLNNMRSKASETSLSNLAQSVDSSVQKTGWIDEDNATEKEELRKKGIPADAMMQLEKEGAVTIHQDNEHGYLIQLEEIKPLSDETLKQKQSEVAGKLAQKQFNLITAGLVASLYRNAIIKHSKTLPFSIKDNAV